MADVITRFKLQTSDYDSKLRDAAKGLKEFSHTASMAGTEFGKFTQKNVEVARSFGNIATSATNTKDKVKELVGAYNDVAKAYNALTKEQQQSDFGKAMAQSLQTLQGRIQEAKAEMNSTGGILGQLKEKFVINVDAVKLFSMGLTAAKAALDVAKDAFFANEQNLDAWGRTVESSESLYKGFLSALNTGDISGYLSNIDNIVKAAQDAYNALDNLQTFNAFNQINVEKTRTGMTESIVDFREGNATKEMVRAAGDAYKKELKERQKLEKEAYNKKVFEVAAQRGVSGKDLLQALSGSYGSYESLKALPMTGSRTVFYGGGMFGGGGSYQQEMPANRQEKLGAALRALNDTELKSLQALGAQAERTGNEIAQVDKQLVRVLNGRQGSGGGGRSGGGGGTTKTEQTEMQTLQKQIQELEQEYIKLGGITTNEADKRRSEINAEIAANEKRIGQIKLLNEQAHGRLLGGNVSTEGIKAGNIAFDAASLQNSLDYVLEQIKIKPIVIPIETVKKDVKDLQETAKTTASIVGTIGQAFNAIEDPAAKVASVVAQAIANIALAYSDALAKDSSSKFNIWSFLAASAASMVSMATAISQIHSATGYAQGGMVKGNTYSGDQIPIMANAGEVVLTKAQQGNLASQLQGSGLQNIRLDAYVTGEQIRLVTRNTGRRTNSGETLSFKNG